MNMNKTMNKTMNMNKMFFKFMKLGFCTLPYKLGNTSPFNDRHDFHLRNKEDILFIYYNFIDSIVEKDEEYIDNVCERGFGEKLKENISRSNLFKNKLKEDSIRSEILSIKAEFHVGVFQDRRKNLEYNAQRIEIRPPSILPSNIKSIYHQLIHVYESKHSLKYFVIKFYVDIQTNYVLAMEPIEDESISEIHNLQLECEFTRPFNLVPIMFKEKLPSNVNVSDLDNFMNGNPLI